MDSNSLPVLDSQRVWLASHGIIPLFGVLFFSAILVWQVVLGVRERRMANAQGKDAQQLPREAVETTHASQG
jgi:hypothetical protein